VVYYKYIDDNLLDKIFRSINRQNANLATDSSGHPLASL